MLTLIKRGKYWHITGTLFGQRIREATGADDKKIAEKILARRIGEITGGATGVKTFADAADEYTKSHGNQRFIDEVEAVLGDTPLSEITQEVIDAAARDTYGGYKRGPKGKIIAHAPSTIKRQFYVPVAAVLHKAAELGWIPYKRIRMPKVNRPPPKWKLDTGMYLMWFFGAITGWQLHEIISANF